MRAPRRRGQPGTNQQDATRTTTTTRTYKGKTNTGTPTSTRTTSTTTDGPATCNANPVVETPSELLITPAPCDEILYPNGACYTISGFGLQPGTFVEGRYNDSGTEEIRALAGVNDDGTYMSVYAFNCPGTGSITNFYVIGTSDQGDEVTSNTVQPCPAR